MPMWSDSLFAFSDDSGVFEIDDAPAGPVAVQCMGTGPSYSNGRCELTVTPGQDATCEVPVVKIAQDATFGSIGAQVQPGPMPARFINVTPQGPADRAGIQPGDIIASIDGASVLKLTPMGVSFVLFPHPIGSTVHLGLTRGASAIKADVTIVAQ
jgi:S1-C subfamily serine protease